MFCFNYFVIKIILYSLYTFIFFSKNKRLYKRIPKSKSGFNKVALFYMEITLWNRSFLVNLLHISDFRTSFYKNTFERLVLFVCLNFDFFAFVLLHSFYVSCELSYFSINWSVKAATGRSKKNLYCIFIQKLLEEVQVLVAAYVVSLHVSLLFLQIY